MDMIAMDIGQIYLAEDAMLGTHVMGSDLPSCAFNQNICRNEFESDVGAPRHRPDHKAKERRPA